MKRPICFHQASGGLGTSTLMCAVALELANEHTVNVAGGRDIAVILGVAQPADQDHSAAVFDNKRGGMIVIQQWIGPPFVERVGADELLLVDGFFPPDPVDALSFPEPLHILVVGAGYVSIANAIQLTGVKPDLVVVRQYPGAALQTRDIEQALSHEVLVEIPTSQQLHRVVDAGLLATRVPAEIKLALRLLVNAIEIIVSKEAAR